MKSPKRRSAALRNRTQPAFIEPMQCKPVTALPAGERWAFELKLDGYRCIAVKHGKEVTLFSRCAGMPLAAPEDPLRLPPRLLAPA